MQRISFCPVLVSRMPGVLAAVVLVSLFLSGSVPRAQAAGAADARRARAAAPARRGKAPRDRAAKQPVAAPRPTPPLGGAGVRVAIDPATGELGLPSPEQARLLGAAEEAALSRSSVGLHQVYLPDGTVMIDLQGRFMDYLVARVDASGKLRVGCVDDGDGVRRLLRGRGVPLSPAEEK